MAEILLSLTIIGVVAAITLPSLTGNINERTWNTQRKALYARFSQAIALMPALNGYGTLDNTTDTAAETFVTEGLSKVLKINNICDNEHLKDCGITEKFTNLSGIQQDIPTTLYTLADYFRSADWGGNSYSTKNTKAAAFETQNGESIIVYYNPSCITQYSNGETIDYLGRNFGFAQTTMCANFIYDLNGNKGPNTVGKDIGFLTAFNATDSIVVAPIPDFKDANNAKEMTLDEALTACRQNNETRLPNINELSSMAINKKFSGLKDQADIVDYWSSTKISPTQAWVQDATIGVRLINGNTDKHRVLCVKR